MKKSYLFFLIIFLIIPAAFADIAITTDQPVYNLGDKIKVSASVMQDKDFEGLFKLKLSCGDYSLQYFLTPLSLSSNFRTAVSVPDLTVTQSMLGNCAITGDLTANDNTLADEKQSIPFSATNQLSVLPVKTEITALPSNNVQIAGVVNEAFGNNVLKAAVKITLDDNSYSVNAVDGKFSFGLAIPSNIKSGKHTIGISASDSKNNVGESSIMIDITAIPSYIKTVLDKYSITPGSKITIVSSLYDQADDLINTTLDLELSSPEGSKVFIKKVQSNENLEYEFGQYSGPGIYILASNYQSLLFKSYINITTIREVKITYENESVFIENTGNVEFIDQLTFFLQQDSNKYPITKKIAVEPGKTIIIDLSKEVPFGVYDVLAPIKDGLVPIKKVINQGIAKLLPDTQDLLASEVTIHDNRPIYKKLIGGLGSMSGILTGTDGVLSKNPLLAPGILVIVLLLIVFHYGRKPIMNIFRRKKDGDKEN